MQRRIYGIENEYGVTFALGSQRRLSPDEVARYLFRRVVSWGRSSNVFLANGARLYLDVGSHPEYATPECDSLYDLVAHDRAGELVLDQQVAYAQERLNADGMRGEIYLFKNNTDSAGNSYGCHENYLTTRREELAEYSEVLIPFLVTRQIYAGAGKILLTPRGAKYCISQRAEHIWEGVSSATTRSRPIINTRDEPHANAELFRRLHVIVGDSNMSEYATFLKVGACSILLQMLEEPSIVLRDMTLENPIRAIREISHDDFEKISDGSRPWRRVRLANGRQLSALDIQREYYERAQEFSTRFDLGVEQKRALQMWGHCLERLEADPLSLDRECDWVIKYRLINHYRERNGLTWDDPRLALLDLKYHDVSRDRGLFYKLQQRDLVESICLEDDVLEAMHRPPQTTRARLRGEFVRRAKERKRDYTVDWVHLKLNDQAQRTVLCKDPFKSHDERVEKLIASL
ncbi:MAG: Pup--protein ligase [bacterium]|nr:Pup--protein ligase [bacterium]MXV90087.1 Pup--protein ligase [Acidimicrobiia bacterium]MYC46483.1 Pup--protein ligase [Acidimicrobiia bacterium]MYI19169.1 Pup--protein ligase [Acidimicrobiia bacterium]